MYCGVVLFKMKLISLFLYCGMVICSASRCISYAESQQIHGALKTSSA